MIYVGSGIAMGMAREGDGEDEIMNRVDANVDGEMRLREQSRGWGRGKAVKSVNNMRGS